MWRVVIWVGCFMICTSIPCRGHKPCQEHTLDNSRTKWCGKGPMSPLFTCPPNPCLAFRSDLVFEVKARTTAQPSSPSLMSWVTMKDRKGPEASGKTFSYLRSSNRSHRDLTLRSPAHNLTIQASHLHTNVNMSKGSNHNNIFST